MIGDRMLKSFARKLVERMRAVAEVYRNRNVSNDRTIADTLLTMALIIEQVAEIDREDKEG